MFRFCTFTPRMKELLRIIFLLLPLALACAYAPAHGQDPSSTGAKRAPPAEPAPGQARSGEQGAAEKSAEAGGQGLSDSAWVSLVGAFIAALAYKLNRSVAHRTVTIEAQKLLVEINKQYISDPKLLAIENEYDAPVPTDVDFTAKLKAVAYLKLNVFEIIFAALPRGQARQTWTTYFEESLDKCNLLEDELEKHRKIYHPDLIRAYDDWKKKPRPPRTPKANPAKEQEAAAREDIGFAC
jgi:hypothetical protein